MIIHFGPPKLCLPEKTSRGGLSLANELEKCGRRTRDFDSDFEVKDS